MPTNIFTSILAAAADAPVVVSSPVDSLFDGTATEPSPGYQPPVPPLTKTLKSYQLAAVETILNHQRVILGLEPGMGKTLILQTVAAAQAAQGKRVINIVPPSLRISPWAEDYATDFPHLKVHMVEGQTPARIPDADVLIVGDSIIKHRLQDLMDWAAKGDVMVTADEAHRFKSRTAKRTVAALALCDSNVVTSSVMATGTLSCNHAGDVYAPLRISGRENAKRVSRGDSWTRFMDEWCDTETVWTGRAHVKVVTGCKDVQGLRAKLLSTCMISVPRKSVLDLPERIFPIRNLVLNGEAKEYRRMEKDFLNWVMEVHGEPAMKRAAKAEAVAKLMRLWQADGLAKAKATVEYVEALVEQDEQVVVMAWHGAVIEKIRAELEAKGISTAIIQGGVGGQAKADIVNKFQAGGTQVIIGQIAAAGTGLTLHAAHHIVFAQLPWSPAAFAQACDRIYRIGQKNECSFHVLNGMNMVSQRLWEVIQAKASITDSINTGVPSTVEYESIQEAVLSAFGW